MAYDRYDDRDSNRGYADDRQRSYRSGDRDERGFFDRARDEVTSWFGDDDAARRRQRDDRMSHDDSSRRFESHGDNQRRGYEPLAYDRDDRQRRGREDDRFGRSDRSAFFGGGQSTSYGRGRDDGDYRNQYGRGGGESGGFGSGRYDQDRDEDRYSSQRGYQSQGSERYRPMTGDYGRSENDQGRMGSGMGGQDFGQQQYGSQDRYQDQGRQYNYGGWGDRDSQRQDSGRDYARAGMMGAGAGSSSFGRSPHDEHYSSWRQRQIEDLDRDYDEYRREHQSRFENEFSTFRTQRQTKRQMLQSIREHFEVVDESGQHVGTVDKVRGDKVILTKNDPEAGGIHRSFTCTLLEKVEGNKVFLSGTKDSIRSRLTEEREDDYNRDRSSGGGILGALFGSDDNDRRDRDSQQATASQTATTSTSTTGKAADGPHALDQSFSGTYEDGKKTK